MYGREGSGKRCERQETGAVRRTDPLPSSALHTDAHGRILGCGRWISTGPTAPRITSNYRAAPTVCFRLSIATPRQKDALRGVRLKKDDPKSPARSDVLGVVEAAYHLVKCFRRALRVCNTVVKIDEFHIDSNFSGQHAPRNTARSGRFRRVSACRSYRRDKQFPSLLLRGEVLPTELLRTLPQFLKCVGYTASARSIRARKLDEPIV